MSESGICRIEKCSGSCQRFSKWKHVSSSIMHKYIGVLLCILCNTVIIGKNLLQPCGVNVRCWNNETHLLPDSFFTENSLLKSKSATGETLLEYAYDRSRNLSCLTDRASNTLHEPVVKPYVCDCIHDLLCREIRLIQICSFVCMFWDFQPVAVCGDFAFISTGSFRIGQVFKDRKSVV